MANHNVPLTGTAEDLNYFCSYNGYQDQIEDENGNLIPNPQTKLQFLDERIQKFANDCAIAGKAQEADITKQATLEAYSPSFTP